MIALDIFFGFNFLFGIMQLLSFFFIDIFIEVFMKSRWNNIENFCNNLNFLIKTSDQQLTALTIKIFDIENLNNLTKKKIIEKMNEMNQNFDTEVNFNVPFRFEEHDINNSNQYFYTSVCRRIIFFLFKNKNICNKNFFIKSKNNTIYKHLDEKFFFENMKIILSYYKITNKIDDSKPFTFEYIRRLLNTNLNVNIYDYHYNQQFFRNEKQLILNLSKTIDLIKDRLQLINKRINSLNEEIKPYQNDYRKKNSNHHNCFQVITNIKSKIKIEQESKIILQVFLNALKYYYLRVFQLESTIGMYYLKYEKKDDYIYHVCKINFLFCLIGLFKYRNIITSRCNYFVRNT